MKAMLIIDVGDNNINDVMADVIISNLYGKKIINYQGQWFKPIPEKIDIDIAINLIKALCIYNEEIAKTIEKE